MRETPRPRRQLGLFDAIMIVMGGIVGAGIFANPSEVAHRVHTPFLILGVWVLGGLFAMCGAFIWAELAMRLPAAGGQYLYLREAYHPAVAFVYGWGLLLITQTGGMAAVAVIFASYFRALTGADWNSSAIAVIALLTLAGINCLGARTGSNVQSALMLLKIGAIAALVMIGFTAGHGSLRLEPFLGEPASFGLLKSIGAAMVPIAFAYGGWQTATFLAGEMRDARRDLSRGLLIGVAGVVALYLAVNLACLRVLGPVGLDATTTPASNVMRIALGERGAQWIAAGIAVSTLGFLSQSMLTAPRVYYAMARDGLFFKSVGKLFGKSGTPVVAIVLQGLAAIIIALSGTYGEILNFEVTVDFIFFGMTAASLFILRRRSIGSDVVTYRVPGHPFTTILFVLSCAGIVISAVIASSRNSAIALCIMLAALPVYYFWTRFRRTHS
ncbi:MAG: amino acid transporter [Verrucomicrobia bacterium]|nr:MAG: amino acid transporter [Verrucomicrobiota bacterium]PYL80016.1 MAG: amino acid transporter [Verrucomicrobiota bacterium]